MLRKPIGLSLSEPVIEKIKSRARRNNRSVSREVDTLLRKALRIK